MIDFSIVCLSLGQSSKIGEPKRDKSKRFSKEEIDLVERQLLIIELNLSSAKFLQAFGNLLIVGN
jgi:hypothetical protein